MITCVIPLLNCMCKCVLLVIYFECLIHISVANKVTETETHKILGKELTVELMEPKKPPPIAANTFTDGYSMVINNVSESISKDLLYLYIDNVTELDGEGGDYVMKRQVHDRTQLVVTFNSGVDLPQGGEYNTYTYHVWFVYI